MDVVTPERTTVAIPRVVAEFDHEALLVLDKPTVALRGLEMRPSSTQTPLFSWLDVNVTPLAVRPLEEPRE